MMTPNEDRAKGLILKDHQSREIAHSTGALPTPPENVAIANRGAALATALAERDFEFLSAALPALKKDRAAWANVDRPASVDDVQRAAARFAVMRGGNDAKQTALFTVAIGEHLAAMKATRFELAQAVFLVEKESKFLRVLTPGDVWERFERVKKISARLRRTYGVDDDSIRELIDAEREDRSEREARELERQREDSELRAQWSDHDHELHAFQVAEMVMTDEQSAQLIHQNNRRGAQLGLDEVAIEQEQRPTRRRRLGKSAGTRLGDDLDDDRREQRR